LAAFRAISISDPQFKRRRSDLNILSGASELSVKRSSYEDKHGYRNQDRRGNVQRPKQRNNSELDQNNQTVRSQHATVVGLRLFCFHRISNLERALTA